MSLENAKQSQKDIEAMIALEDNKEQRALLIVLNNINQALVANTELTREYGVQLKEHIQDYKSHKENFETHTKKEEELMNKGKGAWKTAGFFLGIIQIVVLAAISISYDAVSELQDEANANTAEHQVFKVQLDNIKEIFRPK